MNCRLFSQHEHYTTESQIVKLIYDIMILTARSMLLKSSCPKKMGGFTYLPFSQKSFYFSFYNVSRKRMNASLPSVVHLYTPASSRTWVNTIPISF